MRGVENQPTLGASSSWTRLPLSLPPPFSPSLSFPNTRFRTKRGEFSSLPDTLRDRYTLAVRSRGSRPCDDHDIPGAIEAKPGPASGNHMNPHTLGRCLFFFLLILSHSGRRAESRSPAPVPEHCLVSFPRSRRWAPERLDYPSRGWGGGAGRFLLAGVLPSAFLGALWN